MRLRSSASIIALLLSAAALAWPAESTPRTDDRDTALWVMRKGGRVLLTGALEYTSDPFELPEGEIRIAGVDMHGTVVDGKEMEPLGKLPELREVFIPARVWSPTFDKKGVFGDEMFDYFANSSKLVKFEAGLTTLAYLRLGEAGVQRLAKLPQMKDLRICLVTIKSPTTLAPFVNMETLDLNDANITDDMMPSLAAMKHLRRLTMVGTLVTDDGLKYIRELTDLEELDLYGVKITDVGVQQLKNLKKL